MRQPFWRQEVETSCRCLEKPGDPGGSRTPNPQIRSLMLYPVELRGRNKTLSLLRLCGIRDAHQSLCQTSPRLLTRGACATWFVRDAAGACWTLASF